MLHFCFCSVYLLPTFMSKWIDVACVHEFVGSFNTSDFHPLNLDKLLQIFDTFSWCVDLTFAWVMHFERHFSQLPASNWLSHADFFATQSQGRIFFLELLRKNNIALNLATYKSFQKKTWAIEVEMRKSNRANIFWFCFATILSTILRSKFSQNSVKIQSNAVKMQ